LKWALCCGVLWGLKPQGGGKNYKHEGEENQTRTRTGGLKNDKKGGKQSEGPGVITDQKLPGKLKKGEGP